MKALTGKRRVFVEQYLECWNATEAARRAGYKHPGQQGHRLLKNVQIQAVIDQRLDEMAIPANEVLARLGQQARASIGAFIKTNGQINWQAVKEQGHLVKRITKRAGSITIELYDAQTALMHLDKHHGGKDGASLPDVVEVQFDLSSLPAEILQHLAYSGDDGEPEAGGA